MALDERFHPLVEGTSAAIFVFDDEQILYINPACKSLTGRSARELLGRPFSSLLHPRYRPDYEGLAAGSTRRRDQLQFVHKGGSGRWVDLRIEPVMFRGSPASIATAFDIHDLKRSELARREVEVQLKLVQRAGRTVSWDWRIATDELAVYGLPSDLLTHGAPSLVTTAKALFDHVHVDDLVALKQALRKSTHDREPLFLEIGLTHPDGDSRWVMLRGQAVVDPSGQVEHLVGVATDVTERRRAELALVQQQERTLEVLASISDGVIETDLEGVVVDISASAERILGAGLKEMKGHALAPWVSFVDDRTGVALSDPVTAAVRGEPSSREPQTCLLRRREGEDLPIRFHTAILRDRSFRPVGVVLVIKDMLAHKKVERGMVYLATHDPLTDLVNRSEFERQLAHALESGKGSRREDTLLYMDLDGFKLINDTFGHPAGDKMLKQFASFLKCRFRETDTLGRLGGDKFGILLQSCPGWQARELAEKLYKDLRSFRFEWEETSLPVSLSTGLTSLGAERIDVDKALGAAEAACYLAKQQGGDRFQEFEPQQLAASERQSQLAVLQRLQDALRENSFTLYAQKIEPLQAPESNPVMYEILVRLQDRRGGELLPASFIPIAERHRIVAAIDRLVLTRTLETIAEHRRRRPDDTTLFSINVSGQSLSHDRFLEFVLHELSYRGVEPAQICFEITETATITNFKEAQRFISVLKGRGCGFVLDDFGSGLSSFAYLRNFPVDFIKIDGQFVQGIAKDPTQRALVESINHVGHVMQIKTIAEAVEDADSLQAVRAMRVDYAQGHGVSREQPLDELLAPPAAAGGDLAPGRA